MPNTRIAEHIHATKYRLPGESFNEAMARVANALKDSDDHFTRLKSILRDQRFLPGGRVQAAMGAPRSVTPYNCFVSRTIPDSMAGIMAACSEAAETMRLGGGIGYDFSTLRPRGDRIKSLDSQSSGPVSFMGVFDAVCKTISSAGHRRGAQMAVLRVDHPDIEEFIRAKQNQDKLTAFNISVGITDAFMVAVKEDADFDLVFDGRVHRTIKARPLWDEIMRCTWDYAEPGVLFLDAINRANNLWYCEDIAATNPCGEQPLPPYGACLLGSFNLTKYVHPSQVMPFNWHAFRADIADVVRAMDNVVDRAIYPLPEQEREAKNKRRMGLGITGFANASEVLGHRYGDIGSRRFLRQVLSVLMVESYTTSADLALEKGAFPLWDKRLLDSGFAAGLPMALREKTYSTGLRNSHLLSIAPTGTISITADNISSGIEPVFSHEYERVIQNFEGSSVETVRDYGWSTWGIKGVTADECSASDHVAMLNIATKYVDSAVSKTCNVGAGVSWDDFKDLYMQAWLGGAKGCTTFRAAGKRMGILKVVESKDEDEVGTACVIDPVSGERSCGD